MKAYQNLNITGSINLSGSFYAPNVTASYVNPLGQDFVQINNKIKQGTAQTPAGNFSVAMGNNTLVSGAYSMAIGAHNFISASSNASFIAGQYNTASEFFQAVVGQFNALNNNSAAFIVGGGTSTSNRKNTAVFTTSSIILSGSVEISGSLLLNGLPPAGGGGATVTVSGSAPSGSVSSGSLWYNPTGSGLYIQTTSPTGSTYVLLNPPPVTITGSIPSGLRSSGSLWWNENDGNLYVQVTSPTGSTYVPATNTVAGGNYGATYAINLTGSTWNINHNLNTRTPLVTIYSGSSVMIPASITSTDLNNTTVVFSGSVAGTAILSTGIGNQTTNNAVSASFATTASFAVSSSFATTASFAVSSSRAVSASFATTASYYKTLYANLGITTDVTSFGSGSDISWNTTLASPEIGLSGTTITLPAGTWRFDGTVNAYNYTSAGGNGYLNMAVVTASNNTAIPFLSIANPGPVSASYNYSVSDRIIGITTFTQPTVLKVRAVVANGTATLANANTRLLITSMDR